jgi:hypothetical protein
MKVLPKVSNINLYTKQKEKLNNVLKKVLHIAWFNMHINL